MRSRPTARSSARPSAIRATVALALAIGITPLAALPASAEPAAPAAPAVDGAPAPYAAPAELLPLRAVPITGDLVSSVVSPVPETQLSLIAWGPDEELTEDEGAEVRSLVVATTQASRGGTFRFIYDDTPEMAEFVDVDGNIDFTIEGTGVGEEFVYAFTRRYMAGPSIPVPPGPEVFIVNGVPSPEAEPPIGDGGATPGAPILMCAYFKLKTYGPRWVTVGDATTTSGVTARLTYALGATSTIGVGVSASGAYGSFKVSGTSKVSSNVEIGFPSVTGVTGRQWKTQFIFAKFGYRCAVDPAGKYRKYVVKAVEFAGGTQAVVASIPAASHCTQYLAGSYYSTASQKAVTWSSGAGLGSDIGISLTSQTGFDSKTKLRFDFASKKKLCGTNALPPTAARLVAKP
jgi:hypothetical protein